MRYQPPTPPVPQSLAEVTITEEFTETSHHQPFLLYNNGQDAANRMLDFCTDYSLQLLADAQTLFMDGTFAVAPHPFRQLYSIRVPFRDVTITSVYNFLPNKNQDTYRVIPGPG